jgi:hypothetical protein
MEDAEVIYSDDRKTVYIKSDKTEKKLVVYLKPDGYGFYSVKYESGAKIPKDLEGRWTRQKEAIQKVLGHLADKPVTPRKRVNDRAKKRQAEKEALNGADLNPKNS